MATGVDSLGQFQFGDLVTIDSQTVGVIVQIQKDNFQVNSTCSVVDKDTDNSYFTGYPFVLFSKLFRFSNMYLCKC